MVINQTIAGIVLVIGLLFLISGYDDVAGFCGFIALFIALDTTDDHHSHTSQD